MLVPAAHAGDAEVRRSPRLALVAGGARALWVASAALAVALTATGCGTPAGSRGPEVATAQHSTAAGSPDPASTAPVKESDYDKALRFTRCMTENGVPLSDPVEGKDLTSGLADGMKGKPGEFFVFPEGVIEKCRPFLPATWPVKVDPATIARYRPYGKCMREQGFESEWPEPDANGMMHVPPGLRSKSPELKAAEDACRHLIDEAEGDN